MVVVLLVAAAVTLDLLEVEADLGGGRDGGAPGPFFCASGVRLPPVDGEEVLEVAAVVGAFGDFRPTGELDGLLMAFLAAIEVDVFIVEGLVDAGRSCGLAFRTSVVLRATGFFCSKLLLHELAGEFVVVAVVVEGFCLVTMELSVGTGGGSLRVRPLVGAEDPRLLPEADKERGVTADIIMGMAVNYYFRRTTESRRTENDSVGW